MKSSKHEIKQQSKVFDKKLEVFEKKIADLNEFRAKKLAEEREEKLRKKKEIKKANRKLNAQYGRK